MRILNRNDRFGLIANSAIAVLSVLLTNAAVALINPVEMSSTRPVALSPPGHVIGLVWVALCGGLGAARWVAVSSLRGSSRAANPIVCLLVFCLAYPLYTAGLQNLELGLLGSLATIAFACFVVARIAPISPLSAALVAPVIGWVSFATVLIVQQIRS